MNTTLLVQQRVHRASINPWRRDSGEIRRVAFIKAQSILSLFPDGLGDELIVSEGDLCCRDCNDVVANPSLKEYSYSYCTMDKRITKTSDTALLSMRDADEEAGSQEG